MLCCASDSFNRTIKFNFLRYFTTVESLISAIMILLNVLFLSLERMSQFPMIRVSPSKDLTLIVYSSHMILKIINIDTIPTSHLPNHLTRKSLD